MASDDHGDNPWTRPSVFLSIAFLVLAVLAGSIVLIRTHPGGAAAAAVPSASAPAVTTGVTPSPAPSTTPTKPTATAGALPDQTVPVTAPPATWITVETLSLPTSPLYGPKVNDGTVMAGYQHSPTGALFADADNRGRFGLVPNWRKATLSAVANTPGRAAFMALRQSDGSVTPAPGDFTQVGGFNFLSSTPDKAVIEILNVGVDGTQLVTDDTMVWEDGDWKVLLPPSGDAPPGSQPQSIVAFIPWKDSR